MKFTEDQKDLLALLPTTLKNSNELTDSSKLVLSNIIFLYGMEDAQKNGYVYRSYDDLMKDTFIKSKTSISKAIALLVQKEYIKVKSGRLKERKANEFTLLDETLLNKKCTEKCTEKCTLNDYCSKKCSNNCSNEIETLQNQVLLLQKQMVLLQKEIEELKKCTEKCTTESDTEKEYKKPVEQIPVVIESDKENKKPVEQTTVVIKEKKENEMNERSECNGMNATNGMNVVNGMIKNEVKRNDAISSTSGNNNTVGKAYTPKVRPSSSETSNKAICDVQTPKMEQLPTEEEKVQQDAKEMPQTEREAKIASIMSNIELNKDVMLKAKSQMQFDAHFEDFKRNMANLKQLVSKDAYDNYRSTQGKWWKATVKYLIWYKDPNKKPTKPTKPTVEQMGNYQYHLDSMRIAQKIEDMENALNRMNNWFEKMEALYTKTVMEQYWNKFKHDCASVKKSNPIFEEWQKKINQPS